MTLVCLVATIVGSLIVFMVKQALVDSTGTDISGADDGKAVDEDDNMDGDENMDAVETSCDATTEVADGGDTNDVGSRITDDVGSTITADVRSTDD